MWDEVWADVPPCWPQWGPPGHQRQLCQLAPLAAWTVLWLLLHRALHNDISLRAHRRLPVQSFHYMFCA